MTDVIPIAAQTAGQPAGQERMQQRMQSVLRWLMVLIMSLLVHGVLMVTGWMWGGQSRFTQEKEQALPTQDVLDLLNPVIEIQAEPLPRVLTFGQRFDWPVAVYISIPTSGFDSPILDGFQKDQAWGYALQAYWSSDSLLSDDDVLLDEVVDTLDIISHFDPSDSTNPIAEDAKLALNLNTGLSFVPMALGDGYVLAVAQLRTPEQLKGQDSQRKLLPAVLANPVYIKPEGEGDWEVTFVDAPASVPAGGMATFDVQVQNLGPSVFVQSSDVRLYVSADAQLDLNQDILLDSQVLPADWRDEVVGQAHMLTFDVPVPMDVNGVVHLIAVADVEGKTQDHDRTNNLDIIPIALDLTPHVDLKAVDLAAPESVMVGKQAVVSIQAQNAGNVSIRLPEQMGWIDTLILSKDDQIGSGDRVLWQASSLNALSKMTPHATPQTTPQTTPQAPRLDDDADEANGIGLLPQKRYTHRRVEFDVPADWPVGEAYLIAVVDQTRLIQADEDFSNNQLAVKIQVQSPQQAIEHRPALGDPDMPDRATVAWISLRDFRELVARQSELEQPSAQMVAESVPDAPMWVTTDTPSRETVYEQTQNSSESGQTSQTRQVVESGPTSESNQIVTPWSSLNKPSIDQSVAVLDENATSSDAAEPDATEFGSNPQGLDAQEQVEPALAGESNIQGQPAEDQGDGAQTQTQAQAQAQAQIPEDQSNTLPESAQTESDPADASNEPASDSSTQDAPVEQPSEESSEQSSEQTGPPDQSDQPEKQQGVDVPTSSIQSDLESPAVVKLKQVIKMTPGHVLTGKGLRIRTATPRIDYVVRRMVTPDRNPIVAVTFDRSGAVVHAQIVQSSGQSAYDGPVLNSAWLYRADGEQIQALPGLLEVKIKLILVEEIEPEAEKDVT